MMKQLLRLSGIALPSRRAGAGAAVPTAAAALPCVFVIGNRGGKGGDMVDELVDELRASGRVTVEKSGQQALADADKVLVLLSEGVLQGERLDFLVQALAQDATTHVDRLQTVCRTELEGWVFGSANAEVAAAPVEVQEALSYHEVCVVTPKSRSES